MSIIQKIRERTHERLVEQANRRAELLFQIEESGGLLWLTHNGNKVCPTTFLKDDALEALAKMRELYVKGVTKQ